MSPISTFFLKTTNFNLSQTLYVFGYISCSCLRVPICSMSFHFFIAISLPSLRQRPNLHSDLHYKIFPTKFHN